MAARPLLALPNLHDQDVPLTSRYRQYAMRLVRHEAQRVAAVEAVTRERPVALLGLELTTLKVGRMGEHHVDGQEGALVKMIFRGQSKRRRTFRKLQRYFKKICLRVFTTDASRMSDD